MEELKGERDWKNGRREWLKKGIVECWNNGMVGTENKEREWWNNGILEYWKDGRLGREGNPALRGIWKRGGRGDFDADLTDADLKIANNKLMW